MNQSGSGKGSYLSANLDIDKRRNSAKWRSFQRCYRSYFVFWQLRANFSARPFSPKLGCMPIGLDIAHRNQHKCSVLQGAGAAESVARAHGLSAPPKANSAIADRSVQVRFNLIFHRRQDPDPVYAYPIAARANVRISFRPSVQMLQDFFSFQVRKTDQSGGVHVVRTRSCGETGGRKSRLSGESHSPEWPPVTSRACSVSVISLGAFPLKG